MWAGRATNGRAHRHMAFGQLVMVASAAATSPGCTRFEPGTGETSEASLTSEALSENGSWGCLSGDAQTISVDRVPSIRRV